ncbi:pancreatic triacylglycerol lipase-like isoform X2 [Tubulanus polymorphus]|uniref:pancreatic triacylglycerol lipase-like isoform X2 n=1 Tax=Tubulanus polymorphus TaxID=672921 RepID=UPI003DA5E4A8
MFLPALILISVAHSADVKQIEKRIIPITRCYGVLGCLSTDGPFNDLVNRPLQLLPQDRRALNTTFILHTRKNTITEQFLEADNIASISNSLFDPSKKTRVIIHGFIDHARKGWVKSMKTELLRQGDYNVILVDWSKGSGPPYTLATANTRLVGAEIAHLINYLQLITDAKETDFHLIGHSLGAHVAGYAGERLQGLGRITGLDPASPYFANTDPAVRLDPTDARFVDVIHTDAKSILNILVLNGGFGIWQPSGHVDFYVNGGNDQPGCTGNLIEKVTTEGIYEGGKHYVACDHLRAYYYFIESINSKHCQFKAFPCNNYEDFKVGRCMSCGGLGCAYMGFYADTAKPLVNQTEIKYFLDTADTRPYCRKSFAVKFTFGDNKERGDLFINLHGSNGATGEIKITKEAKIEPFTSHGYTFLTDYDIGDISLITVWWIHDPLWIWEWHVPLIRKPKLIIDKIVLMDGDAQKSVQFCGNGYELRSTKRKTFTAVDQC